MTKVPKIIYITLAVLIAIGGVAINGIDRVRAVEPGVYTIPVGDATNFDCGNLNAYTDEVFAGITSDFGFKIPGAPTGTYPLDESVPGTELTGGAPADPDNEISILALDAGVYSFNWWATLGIDAVIVKASGAAEVYVYIPEAYQGGPLWTVPKPPPQTGYYAISHIEFCYDYELTATKTAETSYTRTYTWDITKGENGDYDGFIGDPAFLHPYTVSVDRTETDSNWAVSGTITVTNPTPFTVGFSVSDMVDGMAAAVTCPSYSLTANDGLAGGTDEVTCTYSASLAYAVDGTNTATVTSTTTGVGGATATAGYAFGDPTTIVGEPTVNVTDSFQGALGSASGDYTLPSYAKEFQCSDDPDDYVAGVYPMTPFVNTATITETGDYDDATVNLTCYAPVVSKDAAGAYDERHEWTVVKTVDPLSQSGFIGDTVPFNWTITVNEEVFEENFAVTGTIYVQNPAPMEMTVSVADVLDDGTPVVLACGGSLTIAAGQTGECAYSAEPNDDSATLNTATATLNGIPFEATHAVAFIADVSGASATLSDDQYPYSGVAVYDDWTSTYPDSYTCSTNKADYDANGADLDNQVSNTATVTYGSKSASDGAVTEIDCYIPSISKNAAGTYAERHEWDVEKSVDPASQSAFAGQTVNFNWTVTVTESVFEEDFDVAGTITVDNPNPEDALVVALSDVLSDATVADITGCTGGTYVAGVLSVPAGGTAVCDYEANDLVYSDVDLAPDLNTATITINDVAFTHSAAIDWTANVTGASATVDDDFYADFPLDVTEDSEWNYPGNYTCSDDPADYGETGMDLGNEVSNTATVTYGGGSDSSTATEVLDCYAPVVSKTANGTYDETHTWDIEKTVTPPAPFGGMPGDELSWTWTVNLSETSADSNFLVTGDITVTNPVGAPGTMSVDLEDILNDTTVATLGCELPLIIEAGQSATCAYTAVPTKDANLNTVTATFNEIEFTAEAAFLWDVNVINGSAVVTDGKIGLNVPVTAGEGPWEWSVTQYHTCSSNKADYGTASNPYVYGEKLTNTAYVGWGETIFDSSYAETAYTCKAGFVDLLKLTNGVVDPTKFWSFALYLGPDGFGTTPIAEATTFMYGEDALLFDNLALRPNTYYTICELGVAGGWTSFWQMDSGSGFATVVPYNPNADDSPPADVGNRCVDFIPAILNEQGQPTAPTTVHFQVDNTYPGGDPRTPGYWKNWNRCTGGGQAATADANGGWEEGFWLLEDVLDPSIGGGIVWDDILTDDFVFNINTCQLAVSILDTRDFSSGKQMASDPGYNLAKHLLASQLNLGAGACVPNVSVVDLNQVILDAETLLDQVNFDAVGVGIDKKNKSLAPLALQLAGILDQYNNGMFCGSTYNP